MIKRVIYPPVWLVLGLVSEFALSEWLPAPRFASPLSQLTGGTLIVAGLLLLVVAGGLFRRAGTGLIPFRDVSVLVTNGVYRFTRNPMYLGMTLILLGCAAAMGSTLALGVPVVFAAIVELRFIRPEEAMLRERFPGRYREYCRRVRRWI